MALLYVGCFLRLQVVLLTTFNCIQASTKLLTILNTMESWIDEIPPIDQPQRFGNKAYRTWFEKLEQVRDN